MEKLVGSRKIFDNKINKLNSILKSYNINAETISSEEKGCVDCFTIKLMPGNRYSKIDRILSDIGIYLGSISIPFGHVSHQEGGYVLQIQTRNIEAKVFEGILSKYTGYCPVVLGSDILDRNLIIDLNSLPNLLIGGIPGSGKSMLLHSIIMSCLHNSSSLYLADPKVVEFGLYSDYKNVKDLSNSIEKFHDIIETISSIVEDRFELLAKKGARNVLEYNQRQSSRNFLEPVVLIVDEWADITLQDRSIQKKVCKIAQKGRAAGVSVVIATQRPSSSVISGLIKASFPGRIALKTATGVDSRVILDRKGAEKLIGVGYGLYLDHRRFNPIIFRTPYIEDADATASRLFSSKKHNFFSRLFS